MRTSSLLAASLVVIGFGCSDSSHPTAPAADANVSQPAAQATVIPALFAAGTDPAPDPADRVLLDGRASLQQATGLTTALASIRAAKIDGTWAFTSNVDGSGTNALRIDWPRRYTDACIYKTSTLAIPLPTPRPARMYVQWKQRLGRTETGGGVGRLGEFTTADRCRGGVARSEWTALRELLPVNDAQRLEYQWMAPMPLTVRVVKPGTPPVPVGPLPGSTFHPAEHVASNVTQTLYLQAESAPGANDGVVRLWVDGNLVINQSGLSIGSAAFRRLRFPGRMAAPPRAQSEYFWDIVAWEPATVPDDPPVNTEAVAAVHVDPASATLSIGTSLPLTATLLDAAGDTLRDRAVTWTSSAPQFASVASDGVVTGVAAGPATITATSEGQSGSATLSVEQIAVASISVAPTTPTIIAGGTVQLTATVRDANGAILTGRTVTWESSSAGTASVSDNGLVTGIAGGVATITATSEGKSASTDVTVDAPPPAPVASIAVAPKTASVAIGGTVQLSATTRDASNNVITGRPISWASLDPTVASVSAAGLVTGASAGTTKVWATSESVSDTATITTSPAPVAAVHVDPSSGTLIIGATFQLTATTLDAAGDTLRDRSITWESSAPGIATVGSDGLVTGVAAGSATVTATSEGKSASAALTVQQIPVATVTIAPLAPTILVGSTVQLTATMRDANGATLTGRSVTWATSAPARATVSATGLVTGVLAGSATITATSEGKSASTVVTVQIPPPAPVASITVAPSTASIAVAGTVQLIATTRDASNNVLTGRTIAWQSLNTAVATVSATGLVSGVSAGIAQVRATSESVSDTASVTVTAVPPPPVNGIADPTLLVRATGQHPLAFGYGRSLAAGQTYIDPNTGVTVLKLTSASVPASNGGMYHGYSEGGPNISQAWTGTDGQVYYTVKVGGWLVDIRYSTFTPINWRRVNYDGEIGLAFSMNPATPRIAFLVSGKRVDRYNTATNAIENTGNWPWNISAAGSSPQWLQTQLNDTWIVAMLQSNFTIVAFRPSDGFQRSTTPAQAGASIDEPHLDREFPVAYISGDSDPKNKMVNLETGAIVVPIDPNGWAQDAHQAPMRGKTVAQGHWQANAIVATGIDGRVWKVASPTPTDVNGDYHLAGQWVFNNPNEYFTVDQWASGGSNAIYRGMIGFVSMAGDVRLLAAHDATGTSYESGGQPHPTLAQDGKFVMWVSNMNGSGRYDTFIARVPVR